MRLVSSRRHDLTSAALVPGGTPVVVDRSAAAVSYAFTVAGGSGGVRSVVAQPAGGAIETFTPATTLAIIGTAQDDVFRIDPAAARSTYAMRLDAGAGTDLLALDLSGGDAAFQVRPDGSSRFGAARFLGFETYDLTLGAGTNTIKTGAGADRITGSGGINRITSGAGDDVITIAGSSASIVSAGAGDDIIRAQGAGTSIAGGAGFDRWYGTTADTEGLPVIDFDGRTARLADGTILRGVEYISLSNTRGDVTLLLSGDFAAAGSITEYVGGGRPNPLTFTVLVDASQLSQSIRVSFGYQGSGGGSDPDLEVSSAGFTGTFGRADYAVITGSRFDDVFLYEDAYNRPLAQFDGGVGVDTLQVRLYDYYWDRFAGSLQLEVREDGSIVSSIGALTGFEKFDLFADSGSLIVTGDLADTITAGGSISGRGGNDLIYAFAGSVVNGGDGNDRIETVKRLDAPATVASVLEGGAGDDTIIGSGLDIASYRHAAAGVTVNLVLSTQDTIGAGIDTMSGIAGLLGSAHDDVLTGNGIANTIEGGLGNDQLDGGGGIDTVHYASAPAGVVVSLAETGAQDTRGAGIDTLVRFENLTGSAYDDILGGDAGDNRLNGGAGDDQASYAAAGGAVAIDLRLTGPQDTGFGTDTLISIEGLIGSAFDDVLVGNAADNRIEGGAGNDQLDGGTGFDIADYATAAAGVTVSLQLVGPQDTIGAGRDALYNFEGLSGSAFADTLNGDRNDNILFGGAGDDQITGGFGSDTIDGGAGEDSAIYVTGAWRDYAITATDDGYTVTNLRNGDEDRLIDIEYVVFGGQRYAIEDAVNVAPDAVGDRARGVVETGASGAGTDHVAGNVLGNDRDANLAVAGLGEALSVAAAGKGPAAGLPVGVDGTTISGRFGSLTIHADGSYIYLLDNERPATERLADGKVVLDAFTYQIADAHGATDTARLSIEITGAADFGDRMLWHPVDLPPA